MAKHCAKGMVSQKKPWILVMMLLWLDCGTLKSDFILQTPCLICQDIYLHTAFLSLLLSGCFPSFSLCSCPAGLCRADGAFAFASRMSDSSSDIFSSYLDISMLSKEPHCFQSQYSTHQVVGYSVCPLPPPLFRERTFLSQHHGVTSTWHNT